MASRRSLTVLTLTAFLALAAAHLVVDISSAPFVLPVVATLAVAAFCGYRAIRSSRGQRLAWTLFTATMTFNAAGDIIFELLSYLNGEVVSVSIADVFYLSTYPLAFAAIVTLLRQRGMGGLRDALVDGVTVAVAAGITIWQYFIVNPGVSTTGTTLERWVFSIYPLMDTLVIAALIGLLLTPGRRAGAEWLIGGYLVAMLAADIFYSAMASAQAFHLEKISTAFYIATYGVLAAASVCSAGRSGQAVSATATRYSRLVLLGGALVATPIVAVLAADAGFSVRSSVYIAATLVITTIVIARMTGLVTTLEREQRRLVASEANLAHEATHDSLTGLPNRAALLRRVNDEIAARNRRLALLFLDLDDFKIVNDSLGHLAGDELLEAVGERIQAALREDDMVARLGGDEFVVACFDIADTEEAVAVANRVLDSVTGPATLSAGSAFARTSIGVALWAGHDDATGLLRDADIALYQAKAIDDRRIAVFDTAMLAWANERHDLESSLREAVGTAGGLRVVYQPRVDMASGSVRGVEALARWQRPDGTDVAPDVFIPLAESTGTIHALGSWVLKHAVEDIAALNSLRGEAEPIALSVNLSAYQLARTTLVDEVVGVLAATGMPPTLLTLELTETSLAADPEAATRTLSALRDHGIRVEIDDFGVGYSSLSYLSTYPVDGVKIDRTFVGNLTDDVTAASVVSAIVALSEALQLDVTAEGVESDRQVTALRDLGCSRAQGFHYSRPLDVDALHRYLSQPAGHALDHE